MTVEKALDYIAKGIPVIPVPVGQKGPVLKDWPNVSVTNDNVKEYFHGAPQNIAVQLGKEGSNLADLDLDCVEALHFAKFFAPKTGFVYGRKSNPRSHLIYKVVEGEIKTQSFKNVDHGMLVEVLGKGHASNLPGSIHETGETYEFDEEGEPAQISYSELHKKATLIAACCLMAREWPAKGVRQDMALFCAAALCKAGFEEADVINAIFHVAKYVGDEEAGKRKQAAEDTVKRYQSGKPLKGISGLKETLPDTAYKCFEQWLNISPDQEIEEVVNTLNAKYAFIIVGGKKRILKEVYDAATQTRGVGFITVDAFTGFLRNQKVCIGHNSKGPMYKSQGDVWLDHPNRRSYEDMTFEPGKAVPQEVYNYYQGLGIEPIDDPEQKLCARFLEHWHQVICGGDDDLFLWVLGWLADAVQNPGNKPGTAIVLTGPQGSGKSCAVDYLKPIFEPHYLKISQKEHLFGKFNAHHQGIILMLCEEIAIANDKKVMGVIKDMITGSHMMIERKGLDAIPGRNCLRLIITNNSSFVIPAEADDRRFLVLEVSGDHVNDFDYFESLMAESKNGGAASLLSFLLQHDYSDENLRKPPQTEAMVTQKIGGLDPVPASIYKFLLDGHIHPEGCEWPQWIETHQFQTICFNSIKTSGQSLKSAQTAIGIGLQKYLGPVKKAKQTLPKVDENTGLPFKTFTGSNESQQLVYLLPDLQECRKRFTKATSIPFPKDTEE